MARTQADDSLEYFIREELGCQCPDEVFRDIGIERCPPAFDYWPGERLVSVGSRLLILVLDSDDCVFLKRELGAIVEVGRRMRDSRGFNRFRLVVAASSPDTMASCLMPCFENLEEKDDRVHLHVVATGQVPELPLQSALEGRDG